MKTTYPLLIIAMLSLFVSPSCSKKSSSPAQTCQIITITDVLGSSTTTFNLTYDNEGRLSTEQEIGSSGTTNKVFTYSGTTELVSTTYGSGSTTDSITLNSDGLLQTDYFTDGTTENLTTYTYSGEECQKTVQTAISGSTPAQTAVYSWTDGNATSINSGTTSDVLTYDQTKPSQAGDYFQISQLINSGGIYIKNTNLVSGFTSNTGGTNTIFNFTYTSDNTGKITQLVATYGSTTETISYQYSCN
jgi:hypothetical protein